MAIKLRTGQIDLEHRAATLAMFNKLVIESFTVPKNLEELGWSGAVIAHQLMDEIARIHRQGRSSKEQEEFQRPGVAREYVTVSSGGMFPKNGSSNLPMASSAFMNILAWVISRVEHLP